MGYRGCLARVFIYLSLKAVSISQFHFGYKIINVSNPTSAPSTGTGFSHMKRFSETARGTTTDGVGEIDSEKDNNRNCVCI